MKTAVRIININRRWLHCCCNVWSHTCCRLSPVLLYVFLHLCILMSAWQVNMIRNNWLFLSCLWRWKRVRLELREIIFLSNINWIKFEALAWAANHGPHDEEIRSRSVASVEDKKGISCGRRRGRRPQIRLLIAADRFRMAAGPSPAQECSQLLWCHRGQK